MTKTIKAIKVTAGSIEIVEIKNTLENLQKEVGGYIEVVSIPETSWYDVAYESEPEFQMDIICNEEGKLMGLAPSLVLGEFKFFNRGMCRKVAHDIICGTALIVDHDKDGNFKSLTKEQISEAMDWIYAWHVKQWGIAE